MGDLSLSGLAMGQGVTDVATIQPFGGVSITSSSAPTLYATATVALSTTANGALYDLGIGALSADGSTYTVMGSPADVQAALRGLVFTPLAHEVPVGQAVTTGFTLTASDAAGAVTDTRTTVVATAADTLPTVTDTSATQSPTSSTTDGGINDPGRTSFKPFAYTTITDPDAGATETTAITLAQNGAATDAVGVLSGAGLTKTGVGTYTLAAASPSAETSGLQTLRFTPAQPGVGAALGVTFSVSDGVGAPVTATSSIGLVQNPGGNTVVPNSQEALTVYNDTPATHATHTYATTIDAVLANGAVVYDQSFNLPYSDPQVQAAVTQARAAVQNAGQTPGPPTETASNLTALSSQTTATQTGSNTAAPTLTPTTTFGPEYIGPNVSVPGAGNTEANRGFAYFISGQVATNVDVQTTTTVDRTVTTTSTDLLSQQYLVTGTSTAVAATTTAVVSSSAAGVEGDTASLGANVDGRPVFTADGASVLFESYANNLVTPDANSFPIADLFLKTLATGAVRLVDTTAAGVQPNASVQVASISGDGGSVVFDTLATNLDLRATDGTSHVYEKSLATGALTLIAPGDYVVHSASTGALETLTANTVLQQPTVSANGRYVAALASAPNDSEGELVVFDTVTHTAVDLTGTARAVVGSQAFASTASTLVFETNAHLTAADATSAGSVYTYNTATGALTLASTNAAGVAISSALFPSVAADGTKVAFVSGNFDIYVKNLTTGALTLADTTAAGATMPNTFSSGPSISADGNSVTFFNTPLSSPAVTHVYLKNLSTGALTLVDAAADGTVGNASSQAPAISPDGTKIAYASTATNLVANDTNGASDVFVTSLSGGATPPPSNTAPAITGVPATEIDPGGAALKPFASATVVDTNTPAPTITVQLGSDAVVNGQPQNPGTGGAFAGGGFTVAGGVATFTSTSLAAVQAAVQTVSFTPTAADARIVYTISDSTGGISVASVDVLTTAAANAAPVIAGTAANQPVTDKTTVSPFSTVTVTDPDANQTETVTVTYTAANGTLAGAGFTGSGGTLTGSFTGAGTGQAAAAAQAALEALVFTPTANEVVPPTTVTTGFSLSVRDGTATATNAGASVVATSVNDPPMIGGTMAGQADTAGTPINPFSGATVTDPDTGQATTVTVSFTPGAGTLSGGGFVQTAPGMYSVTAPAGGAGTSAAAAQADLRAAVFTPTAGQSATTTLTVAVSDGQATVTSTGTSIAATFTPPATGGGGGGTTLTTTSTPASVQYGLLTEFQNLERALANGVDANTPGTPVNAAFTAYRAVAAQLDGGQITLAQAETALAHLVDGTISVAVADYAFFTGATPTAQGLNYLVHSTANATDLNDAYYTRFSTENRYINFAVGLATGPGAGAAAFQANYGALSLSDAVSKAYTAVFGSTSDAAKVSAILDTLVPDGLGGHETRATYFAQYGGDGPNGQGTKAAMIGFLLAQAVETGSGVYGTADLHYLSALAHGQAPAFGSELALTYGANINLVGVTPTLDPTVMG